MITYHIEKLNPEFYAKCNNIWDMSEQPKWPRCFMTNY